MRVHIFAHRIDFAVRNFEHPAIVVVVDLAVHRRAGGIRFADIVLRGAYLEKGMASFADLLDEGQVGAIHAYVIARANEDWGESSGE